MPARAQYTAYNTVASELELREARACDPPVVIDLDIDHAVCLWELAMIHEHMTLERSLLAIYTRARSNM